MRVLSGIQPTGPFHWGNYFGAIRQYIQLQDEADDAFYFIANLHALTTIRDRERLWNYTIEAAVEFYRCALGIPVTAPTRRPTDELVDLVYAAFPKLVARSRPVSQ